MQAYRAALVNTGTTMMLSPDSEFFRYFGSNGQLPAANPNLATPIQPTAAPITAPASTGPALDGLGIEDAVTPTLTLQDGSQLEPTVGTEIPTPVEETPVAPADSTTQPAPAQTTEPATTTAPAATPAPATP